MTKYQVIALLFPVFTLIGVIATAALVIFVGNRRYPIRPAAPEPEDPFIQDLKAKVFARLRQAETLIQEAERELQRIP